MMNIKYRKSTHHHRKRIMSRGFTIIEMIIATGLFTTVILISIGAVLTTSIINARVQASRNVTDNLNIAIENIARNMRTGIDYHCGDLDGTPAGDPIIPRDCPSSGGNFISFTNDDNERVAFRLNGTTIEFSENCGSLGCTNWLGMVAPDITISNFIFYVEGTAAGDGLQPRALMIVEGAAGEKQDEIIEFHIQTTVSQRIVDS